MQCEITGCPLPAVRPLRRPGGASVLVVCSSCAEDLISVFGYDSSLTVPESAAAFAQPVGV